MGRETILRNGEYAGYLTSGGYGYTVGRPIGYDYVRHARVPGRRSYELVVATERVPARLHMAPLHDLKGERIRGETGSPSSPLDGRARWSFG